MGRMMRASNSDEEPQNGPNYDSEITSDNINKILPALHPSYRREKANESQKAQSNQTAGIRKARADPSAVIKKAPSNQNAGRNQARSAEIIEGRERRPRFATARKRGRAAFARGDLRRAVGNFSLCKRVIELAEEQQAARYGEPRRRQSKEVPPLALNATGADLAVKVGEIAAMSASKRLQPATSDVSETMAREQCRDGEECKTSGGLLPGISVKDFASR